MSRPNQAVTQELSARACGSVAQATISSGGVAEVMGITSRGIFLKTKPKWVIFLSYEEFRGPMSINLKGETHPLRALTPGELVQLTPGLITVPQLDLIIHTQDADIWQPEHPFLSTYQKSTLPSRLAAFASHAYAHKAGQGLSGLLSTLLPTTIAEKQTSEEKLPDIKPVILSIGKYLKQSQLLSTLEYIKSLLGRGTGLTPSGDDFLIGLLLTINRWNAVLEIGNDLDLFNNQIIEAAYEKTTTLSANLIECAAQGLADERLVNALDYLMAGFGESMQLLDNLLNWGNSSGVDALLGMGIVLR